ncbi:CoA transferase [Pectobacterium aroidearum]|uniref:CoA transferase n=1 Tax=Pectobacterium aroidearum TaxID=1201031 RepID=A0AAW3SRB6_9GAMM|nr:MULTISPECIES: CaiB/BaiF CoA-transferase family protein [Pectobacterium]MBA5199884.1 CoA transferase [Pectobacterium aroidearum]MBA5202605.1 CoA transferase [Pectobacterium aroidearum]MBA5228124.1 CoA transferase [Pectobacterium aroidearum]MBA5232676.1 CoA transferase [Pectobacterium aroidearum]MBA5236783.1 CoA transferase [Pectobacterium aroidearum]
MENHGCKPLAKFKVLDLTNVLAGPFCCHQLAHMGAEVIKVEVPGIGDLARQLGADPELNKAYMGVSFLAQNAGKRSITINLKSDEGKEVLRRLVAQSDVLVENFRPGVMDRLGVGYQQLLEHQPRLIYCAISGFGQNGPLRHLPAYDQIIQGMAGVMDITGAPETAPYRVGYPISDTIGGITAAFAIAGALADNQRRDGYFIDVSMLEATLATMGWAVSNYLNVNKKPQAMGNNNVTASPSGTFRTGDGLINIAANKQQQFEATCHVLGQPEWISDSRFSERQARLQNRADLTRLIEEQLAKNTTEYWWAQLVEAGVPSGPVYSVPQALAHPQIADYGMVATFNQVPGVDRPVHIVRTGFKINGKTPEVSSPPPQLGEHSIEILQDLGMSAEEITKLQQVKAI